MGKDYPETDQTLLYCSPEDLGDDEGEAQIGGAGIWVPAMVKSTWNTME